MQEDRHCIYNGHIISIYEPSLSFCNRAFRYGDALFETIRFCKGKIMFLQDHIRRLKLGMTVLRMNVPAEFNTDNLEILIRELLRRNAIREGGRIRLTVFRNEGGFYTPERNDISFLIEAEPLEHSGYELNKKGLSVDLYAEIRKPINKLSALKTGSALLYVMAGIAKTAMRLDDCLLVNEPGNICEAISANVFVVRNGTMYTPPIGEGCVDGVMRRQIMQLATQNKILTFETPVTVNTLMNGDEIFLTNAIQGLQWVGHYKNKFYINRMATFFTDKLNELAQ